MAGRRFVLRSQVIDSKLLQISPHLLQGFQIIERHGIRMLVHSDFHGLEVIPFEEIEVAFSADRDHSIIVVANGRPAEEVASPTPIQRSLLRSAVFGPWDNWCQFNFSATIVAWK